MDTFTDVRDGESYKIIKIGSLYWLAENLRYQGVSHYFPGRDSNNFRKYGLLYTWENAKAACPDGWRLPTGNEFKQLLRANNAYNNTSVLRNSSWGNGSNSSGSGALPAGVCYSGNHNYFGYSGYWWSSTECNYDSSGTYYLDLGYGEADVHSSCKTIGFSVRYVKD